MPDAANFKYAILGARAEAQLQPWKLSGSASTGYALENSDGRWVWLQGEVERSLGKAGFFWLDYEEAFDYGTLGLQVQREFRFANDAFAVRPLAAYARWKFDSVSVDYGVAGGTLQWSRSLGPVLLRVSGDAFVSGDNGNASGEYYALSSDAFTVVRDITLGAGITQAFDPLDSKTGFMLFASRSFREDVRIDAVLARTVADPVFGSPGNLGFTLSASWRFSHFSGRPPQPLAEVGPAASKGRTVKFSVSIPEAKRAKTVAVSGSFSDWRPIALRRQGEVWTGSVTVEPGTHQYGFLINNKEWYVPPNSADVIDDGFGRKNVTLVVRPK